MTLHIVCDENLAITPMLESYASTLVRKPGREICLQDVIQADALLVRSVTRVNEELLSGSAVKFVGTATAGTDHIDEQALENLGVAFSAAPGMNANAVAEYVLTCIAHVGSIDSLVNGATVGIVGYGHVGKTITQKLLALGARVLVFDPWTDVPEPIKSDSLDDIFTCSIVSLHAALHDNPPWPSRDLLGLLSTLPVVADGLLINAARGPLLNSSDCLRLRDHGWQLVLDTWPDEPFIAQQLLNNVRLGTPHIAGYSEQAKNNATDFLMKELVSALNLPGLDLPDRGASGHKHRLHPVSSEQPASWLTEMLIDNCGLERDDAALRACAKTCANGTLRGDVEQGVFDRLRRDYILRTELAGSEVLLTPAQSAVRPICQAMGIIPITTVTKED